MKIVDLEDFSLAVQPIFTQQVRDENTVLVFLHEALGSIGQWKLFPQQVADLLGLNGIVYERQGYGNSSALQGDRSVDYLHIYAWLELPALLDVILPQEKKVILVGHSDGASIALLFAAKYPERVKAVVSMAAHVIVEDITLNGIAPAVKAYEEGKLVGLQKYHGDKTEKLFYAWADTWNLPAFKNWNICQDIESLTCPLLVLQGATDQYGSELQLDLILKHTPKASATKVLLPKCGHHPHLEATNETLNHIEKWWRAIEW